MNSEKGGAGTREKSSFRLFISLNCKKRQQGCWHNTTRAGLIGAENMEVLYGYQS
jgi:hypothetical protein